MSLLRPLLHIPHAIDWFASEALRVFMQEAKGMIYNSRTPSSKGSFQSPHSVFSVFPPIVSQL